MVKLLQNQNHHHIYFDISELFKIENKISKLEKIYEKNEKEK